MVDQDPVLSGDKLEEYLKTERRRLANVIREHVRGQVALWRQIPNLALEVDGRSGYSDFNTFAYQKKVIPISITGNGHYDVYVSLSDGELVHYPYNRDIIVVEGIEYDSNTEKEKAAYSATDGKVLDLLEKPGLQGLSAQKFVDDLFRQVEDPYFYAYNPRKVAQRRADIRAVDRFLQDTLPPEWSLQAHQEKLEQALSILKSAAQDPGIGLTETQVDNALGHMLYAASYQDAEEERVKRSTMGDSLELYGAREVIRGVGKYVAILYPEMGNRFSNFALVFDRTPKSLVDALALMHGITQTVRPENDLIYGQLGDFAKKTVHRDDLDHRQSGLPTGALLYSPAEIADWILNTPPVRV